MSIGQRAALDEKLSDDVQEFARQMFVTVSKAQQEYAFNAFLSLDLATLIVVLQEEMAEEEALAEAGAETARQEKLEQLATRFNRKAAPSLRLTSPGGRPGQR